MFRKNELAISEWSPRNVEVSAARQREILANGARCVAPGGYLLYSTCTYSTEENEETVADFLQTHPDFSLVPCAEAVISRTAPGAAIEGGEAFDLSLCRRFYPHVSRGEGQFVALMQRDVDAKAGGRRTKGASATLSKADRAVAEDFLRETLGEIPAGLFACGSNAVLFEAGERSEFVIPPAGVVALGAALGEIRRDRLVPHHHFFTAYGQRMKNQIVLSPADPAVRAYLAGEEIAVSESLVGWCAVLLRVGDTAVTLGGGKAVSGRLKNHYPKGLRVR
jgi:NOL1/NOP2/fmu family ribosome biogenesis protein